LIQCRLCGSAEKEILFLGVACHVSLMLPLGIDVSRPSPGLLRSGS
jgi:hypothetical protein